MEGESPAIAVEEVVPPRTEILTFACEMPSDMSFVPTDPDSLLRKPPSAATGMGAQQPKGIVGTITFLGDKSIMIWFGWGDVFQEKQSVATGETSPQQQDETTTTKTIGRAAHLTMGPLVVAMPRMNYKGAFSEEQQASISKLVGSSDDVGGGLQNTRIASQLADRLSQRLHLAVFCSCNLEGPSTPVVPGCDDEIGQQMLRSRAGALAEREIGRILEEKLRKNKEK